MKLWLTTSGSASVSSSRLPPARAAPPAEGAGSPAGSIGKGYPFGGFLGDPALAHRVTLSENVESVSTCGRVKRRTSLGATDRGRTRRRWVASGPARVHPPYRSASGIARGPARLTRLPRQRLETAERFGLVSDFVRVRGPRVTAVRMRARCGSTKAGLAIYRPGVELIRFPMVVARLPSGSDVCGGKSRVLMTYAQSMPPPKEAASVDVPGVLPVRPNHQLPDGFGLGPLPHTRFTCMNCVIAVAEAANPAHPAATSLIWPSPP